MDIKLNLINFSTLNFRKNNTKEDIFSKTPLQNENNFDNYFKAIGEINKSSISFSGKFASKYYRDKIATLKIFGKTNKEISEILDCSPQIVSYVLKKYDMQECKNQPVTTGEIETVRKLIEQGMSLNEITEKMGITRERLYYIRKQGEIKYSKAPTERNKDKISELYNQGKTANEIAKKTGFSTLTIYKALKKWGLTPNKKMSLYDLHKNEVDNLRKQGLGYKKIAEITGISESTTRNIISRLQEENPE